MNVASLLRLPCPVIAMRPPGGEPHVVVGASLSSPIGPAVAIGASASLDGAALGLALIAHLAPDVAIQLAGFLMEAAAEVLEEQGKGGKA